MRNILTSLIFIFCALVFPTITLAATFSLTPNQGSLSPNETTPLEIKLNSLDSINVVSAIISYPADLLDITWINTDSLAFDIPVEQFIGNGQIRISKGVFTPVSGSDIQLATIGITPKAGTSATLTFTDSSAIISSSDSKNILDLGSSTGASFSITSPVSTSPSLTNTPSPLFPY